MNDHSAHRAGFLRRRGTALLILFFAILTLLTGVTVFAYVGNLKLVSLMDAERKY